MAFGGIITVFLGIILSIYLKLPSFLSFVLSFGLGIYMICYGIICERYNFVASLCSFVVDENNNIYYIENINNQNIDANNFNALCRIAGFEQGQIIGSAIALNNIKNGQSFMKHTELYESILNFQQMRNVVVWKINSSKLIKIQKNSSLFKVRKEMITI